MKMPLKSPFHHSLLNGILLLASVSNRFAQAAVPPSSAAGTMAIPSTTSSPVYQLPPETNRSAMSFAIAKNRSWPAHREVESIFKATYGQRKIPTPPSRPSIARKPSNIAPRNLGYYLHPLITRNLSASPRIADIGCGTGSYLVELARQLPKASEFDGFDITSTQFTKHPPSNVRLHVADAKRTYPAQFHGQFDVVHVRLLVGGLDKGDWKIATLNALQLLKHGGAVQWEEANFPGGEYVRGGDASTSAATMRLVLGTLKDKMMFRFAYGWSTLPGVFQQLGMVGIQKDVISSDRLPETRRALAQVSAEGGMQWARHFAGIWSAQELDSIQPTLDAEIAAGAYSRYDIHVAVGFKA